MWSPQHYIEQGRALGRKPEVLENAVEQIERVIYQSPELPSLLTLNHLATRSQVPYSNLRHYVARDVAAYKHFRIRKRSGGRRLISTPQPDLMKVQRWIATHILRYVRPHPSSYAFAPNSSIVDCAARHCGAKWLVKADITNFFPSISEIQAYRVFRSLGYQKLISFELARLTTFAPESSERYQLRNWQNWMTEGIAIYRNRGQGFLPQGAPTSPMLSNLVMRDLDEKIAHLSHDFGLTYTRYSDDLTFSTRTEQFNRLSASRFIWKLKRMLMSSGFHPNAEKTIIVPPGGRKVVLGLVVDGAKPRLSHQFRSILRQHMYYLESRGPIEHAKARDFETVGGMRRHIRGLIDYSRMVDPAYADPILVRFENIQWP